ncbi:MAG: hypothetical protein WDW36_003698 [Sanguina aurantia]
MANLDHLWWNSYRSIHVRLQNNSGPQPEASLKKLLDAHINNLSSNLAAFKAPNDETQRIVLNSEKLQLCRSTMVIDPKLRTITGQISKLLDLDMLQAHVLLKRWVKDEEGQTAKLEAAPAGTQLTLSPDEHMQVLSYYQRERVMLLKCTQFIIMQGSHEPNSFFGEYLTRLLQSHTLESHIVSCLQTSLEALPQLSGMCSSANASSLPARMTAIQREFAGKADMVRVRSLEVQAST